MYSLLLLGIIMTMDSFGFHIPAWVSPVVTTSVVGYFFGNQIIIIKKWLAKEVFAPLVFLYDEDEKQ